MKLDDQVISLELAKKLKELGIKQNSYFTYDNGDHNPLFTPAGSVQGKEVYSSFSAAELGEVLPNTIHIPSLEPFGHGRLIIEKFITVDSDFNQTLNWIINYECDTFEINEIPRRLTNPVFDPNLANAMAKMLIYLIEKGIIKNDK